jgi:tetratricopeptide (TPR) repeat protein
MQRTSLLGMAIAIGVLTAVSAATAQTSKAGSASPKAQLTWWQENYAPLPADDWRGQRAHAIFTRVLNAAGSRPGVRPRLYLTRDNVFGTPVAIALPDGGIVVSKGTLDICYREPQHGDDRLAFVLAHEIAHHLKHDFWHLFFFGELEKLADKRSIEKIKDTLPLPDDIKAVRAKELQADAWGIAYASMAGFNTQAIVSENDDGNFFVDWVQTVDPHRISATPPDSDHLNPEERAATVRAELRRVLDQVDIFQLGLRFYQAGMYEQAIVAFERFLQAYPSREVYHNLATSHHQLALKHYRAWKGNDLALPFQLSITIDPVTRAQARAIITKSGDQTPEALFRVHIDAAIDSYNAAIKLDPEYVLAYNNLGCALLIAEDEYRAIATLQDALKRHPTFAEAQNNLGVAFWYAKRPDEAQRYLTQAHTRDAVAEAPLFNLGKVAHVEGRAEDATRHWTAYLQRDATSPWAEAIREALQLPKSNVAQTPTTPSEHLASMEIGKSTAAIPATWGTPTRTTEIILGKEAFTVAVYANGVVALWNQGKEVRLLATQETFTGTSARGIATGSAATDILVAYGRPEQILHMTQGASWSYKQTHGITFQIRDGQVVSWLLL